jgi:hypothetical protein
MTSIRKVRKLISDLKNTTTLTRFKQTIVTILSELADQQAVKEAPNRQFEEILAKFEY